MVNRKGFQLSFPFRVNSDSLSHVCINMLKISLYLPLPSTLSELVRISVSLIMSCGTSDNVCHPLCLHCHIYKIGIIIPTSEKAMAPHSSTPAWKTPWMEEPGGLQSMGSLRVGHDWATSLSLFTFMHWRRKWQPTPVFLPGESQGRRSLVGCHLWGHTESDMTEAT